MTDPAMIRIAHGDAEALIDASVGNIPHWQVSGREPLHAAPWRDEAEVQDDPDVALVDKRLAGDFLCMPFGRDDVHDGPIHGPPANDPWNLVAHDAASARFALSTDVLGAHVTKEIRLVGSALLSTHVVEGGAGEVTFAHHPMTRMAEGGRLSFSPKRAALTDPVAQHEGANLWALNQLRGDLELDCEDGSQWHLGTYPAGHVVEDFCTLVEARGATLGWTCVMRNAEDDMVIVLKDAQMLPITMLWISNGARDFPPWNSRHKGVLGIEDGRAMGGEGLAAALADNRLTAMGVPTALTLGARHVIRHAMVSLPRPPGWSELSDITLKDGHLQLTEASGHGLAIPFPEDHFD
ncbi:hypothetical protein [Gymnodinialimonas ceratoperidinii]|uniref:Uncharacterized protein n=1 Tax=Gymnodinialimonas ceratoperidinii TaxID=2856823 RepID=A0A8F6TUU6_9RHOB|nr:hypothetical protein [Gymnodinialimonas ceratoperidinii]QXT38283.1 hypothetical protein KYE46_09990 [Gymnodinialimonas ceratoperidinii]